MSLQKKANVIETSTNSVNALPLLKRLTCLTPDITAVRHVAVTCYTVLLRVIGTKREGYLSA
jgi:hypothetical protein